MGVYQAKFQFTLPRGERRLHVLAYASHGQVSIHAPARGATTARSPQRGSRASFNSRSREGSDYHVRVIPLVLVVSIHAPARGATYKIADIRKDRYVSIHAPARGATKVL